MDYNNLTSPNPNYNVDNLDNRSIDMSNNIQPNSLKRDNLSVDYRFGTENFVPEIQRQIIDNYFNGSGSVHGMISEQLLSQNQTQTQETIPPDKLKYYQQLEEFVKTPQFTQALAAVMTSNPTATPPTPNPSMTGYGNPAPTETPTFNPSPETNNYNPYDAYLMNDANAQNTNAEPTMPESPTMNDNNANEQQAMEQLIGLCTSQGVNPQDFISFMNSLTPNDLIELYKAFKEAETESQNIPPTPSPTQAPTYNTQPKPPTSIQNIPATPAPPTSSYMPNKTRNPLWD